MKKIGVLYSGGLDSAALIAFLLQKGYDVWPVYIRSGLRWEKAEIFWANKFLRAAPSPRLHKFTFTKLILDDAYENNWSQTGKTPGARSRDKAVFLPVRNLLLTTKALLALSSQRIHRLALATLRGNPFPDAKKSYFKALERILAAGLQHRVDILVPFRAFTKRNVIKKTREFPLHLSLSCVSPTGVYHCGKCNKCAERKRAFKEAGVRDKTIYKDG